MTTRADQLYHEAHAIMQEMNELHALATRADALQLAARILQDGIHDIEHEHRLQLLTLQSIAEDLREREILLRRRITRKQGQP